MIYFGDAKRNEVFLRGVADDCMRKLDLGESPKVVKTWCQAKVQ